VWFLFTQHMKKLILIFTVVIGVIGCNNDPRTKLPQTGTFGITFDTTNAIMVEDIEGLLAIGNNIGLKATGTISQYCKGEGCWLTLKNNQGEEVLVNVKDKSFVLPYNIEGKTAIVNGVASKDTTAEGAPSISIEADGIMLK
jgi:hypothetical protein